MGLDVRTVFRELEIQGFDVERSALGHYKVRNPRLAQSPQIIISGQDRNGRNMLNMIRDLKTAGFQWPPPDRKRARPVDVHVEGPEDYETLSKLSARTFRGRGLATVGGPPMEIFAADVIAHAAPPPPALPPGPVETLSFHSLPEDDAPEPDLDAAFFALRDAKLFAGLAEDECRKTRETERRATATRQKAEEDHAEALASLRTAKARFDELFSAPAACRAAE